MKRHIPVFLTILCISILFGTIPTLATESQLVNDVFEKQKQQRESLESAIEEIPSITPTPEPTKAPEDIEELTEKKKATIEERVTWFKQRIIMTVRSLLLRYGPYYIGAAILLIILGNRNPKWMVLKKIGWTMVLLFSAGAIIMLFSSQIANWLIERVNNTQIRW
jgi:hypothetical protein